MNRLFTPPAIRIFSHENAEVVPKKPGATGMTARKPFLDREINGFSPRNLKSEPHLKKPEVKVQVAPQLNTKEEDLFIYDTCSFKDINDNYDFEQTRKAILNILRSYCNYNFEPAIPECTPHGDLCMEMVDHDFSSSEETFGLTEESVDDISLPDVDFD